MKQLIIPIDFFFLKDLSQHTEQQLNIEKRPPAAKRKQIAFYHAAEPLSKTFSFTSLLKKTIKKSS